MLESELAAAKESRKATSAYALFALHCLAYPLSWESIRVHWYTANGEPFSLDFICDELSVQPKYGQRTEVNPPAFRSLEDRLARLSRPFRWKKQ